LHPFRVPSSFWDDEWLRTRRHDIIRQGAAPQIEAVCFDGFGTLVEIGDKRRPFRALLDTSGSLTEATQALTTPMSLRDLARDLATNTGGNRLAELEVDRKSAILVPLSGNAGSTLWKGHLRNVLA
jgi:hypothetical protein